MFSVDSSRIPVDSGQNPLEFLGFRGIPGFWPESVEEWKVLLHSTSMSSFMVLALDLEDSQYIGLFSMPQPKLIFYLGEDSVSWQSHERAAGHLANQPR